MSAYLRDAGVDVNKARTDFAGLQDLYKQHGELAVDVSLAAGGCIPVVGPFVDIFSAGRNAWKGEWLDAGLDLFGIVPAVGDGVKGTKVGAKVVSVLHKIDVVESSLRKTFQATEEAARKYWDDIAEAYRKRPDVPANRCQKCADAGKPLKGPQYENTPHNNGAWKTSQDGNNPTLSDRGDGWWHPDEDYYRKQGKPVPPPVEYKNGFPIYKDHIYSRNEVAASVQIPMKGTKSSKFMEEDFKAADDAYRQALGSAGQDWTRPRGYVWHHKEDGVTMELIPRNVHATGGGANSPHTGGASLYDRDGQPTAEF